MLRSLALAVSLSAFAGVAVADCGAHSDKDAMATTGKTLASTVPAVKATLIPPATKQVPACANGICDGVAKPAANTKTAQKAIAPSTGERALVAN